MNVLITLTTAGVDTGPFNLYSNTDSYTTAFQTSVAKSLLVAGYTSTVVPAGTTTIRVTSTGTCTNYVDLVISGGGTTTTTTSTSSTSSTTSTSTSTSTSTTSTTTTNVFISCQEWRNDTAEEATITYTPCGSTTPVSNYALATTSSVCAVFGSITVTVGGPLTEVGPCSV